MEKANFNMHQERNESCMVTTLDRAMALQYTQEVMSRRYPDLTIADEEYQKLAHLCAVAFCNGCGFTRQCFTHPKMRQTVMADPAMKKTMEFIMGHDPEVCN